MSKPVVHSEAATAETRVRKGIPLLAWFFVGIVGAAGFGGEDGVRGGASYLCGLVLAGGWLGLSIIAVDWAGRYSPTSALQVALLSYIGLIMLFAILLLGLDPGRIHTGGFAAGLVISVLLSTADRVRRGWIRSEAR